MTITAQDSHGCWTGVLRLGLLFGLIAALLAGVTGCSLIGDTLKQKTTTKENLEYQRETALKFKEFQPDVEVITFTQEGSRDGSGQWSVNSIVVIAGKEYEEIIGPWTTIGDPLPDTPATHTPAPVTVHYSNGGTEVLG